MCLLESYFFVNVQFSLKRHTGWRATTSCQDRLTRVSSQRQALCLFQTPSQHLEQCQTHGRWWRMNIHGLHDYTPSRLIGRGLEIHRPFLWSTHLSRSRTLGSSGKKLCIHHTPQDNMHEHCSMWGSFCVWVCVCGVWAPTLIVLLPSAPITHHHLSACYKHLLSFIWHTFVNIYSAL